MDEEYLVHYGVKGMRWGVRKKKSIASKSKKGSAYKIAKAHDEEIRLKYKNSRKQYRQAKKQYRQAVRGGSNKAISDAKKNIYNAKKSRDYNRVVYNQNLRGRELANRAGFGRTAQGTYYRARNNGKSKINSALRAYGKQTAINAGKTAAGIAGSAALTYLLSKSVGGNTSLKQLPVADVIDVKKFKVRTV